MLNAEFYKKDLESLDVPLLDYAINSLTREVVSGKEISCNQCLFYNCNNCTDEKIAFLIKEYMPLIKISKYERTTLEYLKTQGYVYCAKDNFGISVHKDKPSYDRDEDRYHCTMPEHLRICPVILTLEGMENDSYGTIDEILENAHIKEEPEPDSEE